MRIQHLLIAAAAAVVVATAYTWWFQPSWTPSWLERTPGAAAPAGGVTGPGARDFRGFAGFLTINRLDGEDENGRFQVQRASFGTLPGGSSLSADEIEPARHGENQVLFMVQVGLAIYFAVINTTDLNVLVAGEPETYPVTWVRARPQRIEHDPATIRYGDGGEIPTGG